MAASAPANPQNSFVASFQRTAIVHTNTEQSHVIQKSETPAQKNSASHSEQAPNFAQVEQKILRKPANNEFNEEIGKLICLLARERAFLIFHWCNFLTLNSIGLFLAFTAYNGYIGDEITKTVIALTPMMIINTFALLCLNPIKGTKKEIGRLKERLSYVRFQAEYSNLF